MWNILNFKTEFFYKPFSEIKNNLMRKNGEKLKPTKVTNVQLLLEVQFEN